jgi:hypothetical protein
MSMRRRLAALPLAIVIGLGLLGSARAAEEPFGRLSVDQVSGKLGKPATFIYDNNSKEDYARAHVPGAKWLEYDSVKAADLPKDKTATLIFYCANEH